MDYMDAEELAAVVLGLELEDTGGGILEQVMYDKLDVTLGQFKAVAEALMPFTVPAAAAISGREFHGFVKDGAFICKQKV